MTVTLKPRISSSTAAAAATPSLVAADELAQPVARRILAGEDRQAVEIALNVRRELLRRGVPPPRLQVHGAEHDGVQIPCQAPGLLPALHGRARPDRLPLGMARSSAWRSSAAARYGERPVSSTWSSTPSE